MGRRLLKYRVDTPTTFLNSIKNNDLCWTESTGEWRFALVQEFNNDVTAYKSQPFTLQYETEDGALAEYTPDFLVQQLNGLFVFEVKSGKYSSKELERTRYEHLKNFMLAHHGLRFEVVFDDEFAPASTIENLKFLYKYRWLPSDLINNFNLTKHMGSQFYFGELKEFVAQKHLSNVVPFGLVAHKKAVFDLSKKLTNNTLLQVA